MKATVLVLTLLGLIVISMVAVYSMPFGLRGSCNEGFQDEMPSMPPVVEQPPMPEAQPSMPEPVPPATPTPMSVTTTTNSGSNAPGFECLFYENNNYTYSKVPPLSLKTKWSVDSF
jgi:hypothetical protein